MLSPNRKTQALACVRLVCPQYAWGTGFDCLLGHPWSVGSVLRSVAAFARPVVPQASEKLLRLSGNCRANSSSLPPDLAEAFFREEYPNQTALPQLARRFSNAIISRDFGDAMSSLIAISSLSDDLSDQHQRLLSEIEAIVRLFAAQLTCGTSNMVLQTFYACSQLAKLYDSARMPTDSNDQNAFWVIAHSHFDLVLTLPTATHGLLLGLAIGCALLPLEEQRATWDSLSSRVTSIAHILEQAPESDLHLERILRATIPLERAEQLWEGYQALRDCLRDHEVSSITMAKALVTFWREALGLDECARNCVGIIVSVLNRMETAEHSPISSWSALEPAFLTLLPDRAVASKITEALALISAPPAHRNDPEVMLRVQRGSWLLIRTLANPVGSSSQELLEVLESVSMSAFVSLQGTGQGKQLSMLSAVLSSCRFFKELKPMYFSPTAEPQAANVPRQVPSVPTLVVTAGSASVVTPQTPSPKLVNTAGPNAPTLQSLRSDAQPQELNEMELARLESLVRELSSLSHSLSQITTLISQSESLLEVLPKIIPRLLPSTEMWKHAFPEACLLASRSCHPDHLASLALPLRAGLVLLLLFKGIGTRFKRSTRIGTLIASHESLLAELLDPVLVNIASIAKHSGVIVPPLSRAEDFSIPAISTRHQGARATKTERFIERKLTLVMRGIKARPADVLTRPRLAPTLFQPAEQQGDVLCAHERHIWQQEIVNARLELRKPQLGTRQPLPLQPGLLPNGPVVGVPGEANRIRTHLPRQRVTGSRVVVRADPSIDEPREVSASPAISTKLTSVDISKEARENGLRAMTRERLRTLLGQQASRAYEANSRRRALEVHRLRAPAERLERCTYSLLTRFEAITNLVRLYVQVFRRTLASVARSSRPLEFEICFCLDNSGSMAGVRGRHMLTSLAVMMETFRRLEVPFSVVKFAGLHSEQMLKPIETEFSESIGEAIIEAMTFLGGSRPIDGLELAVQQGFSDSPAAHRAVIMMSDGIFRQAQSGDFIRALTQPTKPVSFCMVQLTDDALESAHAAAEITSFLTPILEQVSRIRRETAMQVDDDGSAVHENLAIINASKDLQAASPMELGKLFERLLQRWIVRTAAPHVLAANQIIDIRVAQPPPRQMIPFDAIDFSADPSLVLSDIFTHSRLTTEIPFSPNVKESDSSVVSVLERQALEFDLDQLNAWFEVNLRSATYVECCSSALSVALQLRGQLQSRINELADVLGDSIFCINRFTRRKPGLTGNAIHIPSLIRFVLSNYQNRRFMLKRIAGGRREYRICIAIDMSHSLGGTPSRCNFEAAFSLIEALVLLGLPNFSILTFGHEVRLIKGEDQHWDQRAMYQFFSECLTPWGSKSQDGSAVIVATALLQRSTRRGPRQLIVFSDGYGSQGLCATAALQRAVELGIRVLGISVGLDETGLRSTYGAWIQCATPQAVPDAIRSWTADKDISGNRIDFISNVASCHGSLSDIWKEHQPIFEDLSANLEDERSIVVDVEVENRPGVIDIDLCIAMDCTGSMGPWIEAAKEQAVGLVDQIRQRVRSEHGMAARCRVAFIAYRDHDHGALRQAVTPFTEDIPRVSAVIGAQDPIMGRDTPEDVSGAIAAAATLTWREDAMKVFVLIGDAPCHGTRYHNHRDHYPNGDPHGIVPEDVLLEMGNRGIQVAGIMCDSDVVGMWDIFKRRYDTNAHKLELKTYNLGANVDLLTQSVSEFVLNGVFDFL